MQKVLQNAEASVNSCFYNSPLCDKHYQLVGICILKAGMTQPLPLINSKILPVSLSCHASCHVIDATETPSKYLLISDPPLLYIYMRIQPFSHFFFFLLSTSLRGWTRDVSHFLTGHYIDLCHVITQGLIPALWISEEGWDQTEKEHNDTEL